MKRTIFARLIINRSVDKRCSLEKVDWLKINTFEMSVVTICLVSDNFRKCTNQFRHKTEADEKWWGKTLNEPPRVVESLLASRLSISIFYFLFTFFSPSDEWNFKR